MRLRQRSSVDLPQPEGPITRGHLVAKEIERNVPQRFGAPVVHVEIRHPDNGNVDDTRSGDGRFHGSLLR